METNCPVCYQEYNLSTRLPRVLPACGHSFCSLCLSYIIQDASTSKCPLDKSQLPHRCGIEKFPVNFALKEIIESRPQTDCCPDHGEELVLFCLTDKKKICVICLEEEHHGHQTRAFKSIKGQAVKYRKQLADLCETIKEASEHADEMLEKERNIVLEKIEEDYTALLRVLAQKKHYLTARTHLLFNTEKNRIRSLLGDHSALVQDVSRKDLSLQNIMKPEEIVQLEEVPNAIQSFTSQYQAIMSSNFQQEKMEEEFKQIEQSVETFCLKPNLILDQEEKMKQENLLDILRIETHFSIKLENDSLKMRNDKENSQEVEIDMKEVVKVRSAAFLFEQSVSPNDLQLLTFIWGSFTDLVSLRLKFVDDTLIEQLYNIFCSHYFKLQKIEIDIIGYTVEEKSMMISFIRNIFLTAKNIQIINLRMDKIDTDDGVIKKIFEGGIFDVTDLEEFSLNLTGTETQDKDIKPIFIQMPKLKKLELEFAGTEITDETLICLAGNTLASAQLIQGFYLSFYDTKTTDMGVEFFCQNLNSRKIIELQLEFGYTEITDRSVGMIGRKMVALDLFDNLEILCLGFCGTKISDNSIIQLLKPVPKAKDFTLTLHGTKITDQTIYHLIQTTLNSIESPDSYLLYLGDTEITDYCFDRLLTSLKDAKTFILGFENTAISDKTLQPFVGSKLSAGSICEKLQILLDGSKVSARLQEKIKQVCGKKLQK